MTRQMADPSQGMLSFQQALHANTLKLNLLPTHENLYSHFDVPAPGVARLTYVRLDENGKTLHAFLVCTMNGKVDGLPCVAVGYAIPEKMRNNGLAKQIFRDAIQDQILQASRAGHKGVYIEAVADVTNLPSQRVAEAVLGVERESITDTESGRPGYRYTRLFATSVERPPVK